VFACGWTTAMQYYIIIWPPEVDQGRVANPRPVSKIKTGHVSQPITDAAHATGRDRSWIATRPRSHHRCSGSRIPECRRPTGCASWSMITWLRPSRTGTGTAFVTHRAANNV